MKPTVIALALAVLAGCSSFSRSGNAASGSTTADEAPLYRQNPANTENSFSRLR
jgi:hypothetical protein